MTPNLSTGTTTMEMSFPVHDVLVSKMLKVPSLETATACGGMSTTKVSYVGDLHKGKHVYTRLDEGVLSSTQPTKVSQNLSAVLKARRGSTSALASPLPRADG